MKYGRLTIIENAPSKTYFTKEGYKKIRKRVVVKCDCGKTKEVDIQNIISGGTKSCGCLKDEILPIIRKKGHESRKVSNPAIRKLFRNYKASANKKGLDFDLTYSDFFEYTQSKCYYCGIEPSLIVKNETGTMVDLVNGVDRVDNNKGYIKDNMVSCCQQCNYAKRTMRVSEYISFIKRVYEWQKEEGNLT